jgi:Uma2 family endonuclease
MSQIIAAPVPTFHGPTPAPRRWTRAEYYQMAELGWFRGQRVELIEGEIMVLSPQKAEHWTTTDRITDLLRSDFGSGFHVRMQGPIDFGPISEPEPDVAVVAGSRAQYATHHPTTAVLIVEVSESSLDYDRTRKASLYARAGIADYWIVNLVNNQLEVRRDPHPDPSQPYGHGYASLTTLVPPAVVSPLAAPQVSLAVADLLP